LKPEFEIRSPSSVRRGLVDDQNAFVLDLRAQKTVKSWTMGMALAREWPSKAASEWSYGASLKRSFGIGHTAGIEVRGAASTGLSSAVLLLNAGAQIKIAASTKLLLGLGRELHNHDEAEATLVSYLGLQASF
jgi:hypothetical protein